MRTDAEILKRIEEAKPRDLLGFELTEYILALSFEAARPFLVATATEAEWTRNTPAMISQQAKDYMGFWLEKIEAERGISVVRATQHFVAWKWLLGHPDADTFPGAPGGRDGGWYQRVAYEYIKEQIDGGEWDKLTAGGEGV